MFIAMPKYDEGEKDLDEKQSVPAKKPSFILQNKGMLISMPKCPESWLCTVGAV